MDLTDTALKGEGWYLTPDAIQSISNNGAITDLSHLCNKALDLDLREISLPYFPEELSKGKLETIPGNVVVQIQKVRNTSAPKANEESQAAPRLLKVVFTDGHTICYAVEVETVNSLSLNTPPGTKVLLKGESLPMSHGLLLLQQSMVQVLGGKVTALVDKWELNRSLAKHTRGRTGEEGGPPPWIPFGQKILKQNMQAKNFKSLGEITAKENSEFEAQRQGAIAEAASGGARKVFGGGSRPLVDRNVRTLIEHGFSQDQAEQALRHTRNNVDRALQSLQKRGGCSVGGKEERGRRRRGDRDEDGGSGPKPSGQLSLFAFLEDKLPTQAEKDEKESISHTVLGGHNPPNQQLNSWQRGRPGRGSHNTPSESRNRDRSNNTVSKNQKPPRFQNQTQQQRYSEGYQNYNYGNGNDYSIDDRSGFNSTRLNRNVDDYNNDSYTKRSQLPPTFTPYDYGRSNRHQDMHNAGGGYKNNLSRQLLEAGMPDIPEFPFKDASSLAPLLMNNNHNNTSSHTVSNGEWQWKIGDKCMAKYWEDNMYYNAEVTGLSKKTCVVRFLDYGNFEEVLKDDCIPVTEEPANHHNSSKSVAHNNHFSGILEFRRGGTRPYIKSSDSSHRKMQRNSQQMYVPPAQRKD